ncbi:MAG: hypothetical protein DIU72_008960 [Pseudomonadota bacterium]|nr:MAG: hypothetical protein DIU72_10160 [Pseudomonadota bacterium]
MIVLPNLGAEEGRDHVAPPGDAVRAFAWLFGSGAHILDWEGELGWPEALGPPLEQPLFELAGDAFAWFADAAAQARLRAAGGRPILPPAEVVEAIHDKAFAHRAALRTGHLPDCLRGMVDALEAEDLTPTAVEARVRELPPWSRGWVLKPRLGSSGRGGVRRIEHVPGALERLRRRGGAVFEPWLSRTEDLSALLLVGPKGELRWIGTTRLLVRSSGVYLGNQGIVEPDGRICSGSPRDEELCAAAAEVARLAAERGYFGPLGVDAFAFRGPDGEVVFRPVVEVNARFTMGMVAAGLVSLALRRGILQPPAEWVFVLDGEARGAEFVVPLGERARLGWKRC